MIIGTYELNAEQTFNGRMIYYQMHILQHHYYLVELSYGKSSRIGSTREDNAKSQHGTRKKGQRSLH